MCCWMVSLVRFVPFRLVVILPSDHFAPRVAFTIVKASVSPWYVLSSTSVQNALSV